MLTEFQLWVLSTVVMFILSASSYLAEFGGHLDLVGL